MSLINTFILSSCYLCFMLNAFLSLYYFHTVFNATICGRKCYGAPHKLNCVFCMITTKIQTIASVAFSSLPLGWERERERERIWDRKNKRSPYRSMLSIISMIRGSVALHSLIQKHKILHLPNFSCSNNMTQSMQ